MNNPQKLAPGFVNQSVQDFLYQKGLEFSGTLDILNRAVSAPRDRACESLVYHGASTCFDQALKLLNEPNLLAKSISDLLRNLDIACAEHYETDSLADDFERDKHSFRAYPAWKALSRAGECKLEEGQADEEGLAEKAAIGVNFGLAWVGKKKMAPGLMANLFTSIEKSMLTMDDLIYVLSLTASERKEHIKKLVWFTQFDVFLTEFRGIFDVHPNEKPPKKTFDQKVRDELHWRAAFPSPRHRAGVLDRECLSKRQFNIVKKYGTASPFYSASARRVATWLIEFSGLNVGTVGGVPIIRGKALELVDDWAVKFDLETGLLLRDYCHLARDAAAPTGVAAEPASFVFPLPAPKDILEDINDLIHAHDDTDEPITFSVLIPQLLDISPQFPLYPNTDQFQPSVAKLSRTVGPLLILEGMDCLYAGTIVGDMGLIIKSKLYYARITPQEIWQAARYAYLLTGHSEPVAMPASQMAFGAGVVSSTAMLKEIDIENNTQLGNHRDALRLANPKMAMGKLLEFHKYYTITFGFRLMIRLNLRAAQEFPIKASVISSNQPSIDILEKSSAGRRGAMAALLTSDLKGELKIYKLHCESMLKRLKQLNFSGVAMQWLKDVIDGKSVSLLALINGDGTIKVFKTLHVIEACADESSQLAKDFGRKWGENILRTNGYVAAQNPSYIENPVEEILNSAPQLPSICLGCRTEDIDQSMRHEGVARETTTSISDSCERTWAKRMSPVIDRVTREIFTTFMYGLRKK